MQLQFPSLFGKNILNFDGSFNFSDIIVAQDISKVSENSVASVDDFVPEDADQSFNSFLEESPKHSAQEKASDVPEEESERYFLFSVTFSILC